MSGVPVSTYRQRIIKNYSVYDTAGTVCGQEHDNGECYGTNTSLFLVWQKLLDELGVSVKIVTCVGKYTART